VLKSADWVLRLLGYLRGVVDGAQCSSQFFQCCHSSARAGSVVVAAPSWSMLRSCSLARNTAERASEMKKSEQTDPRRTKGCAHIRGTSGCCVPFGDRGSRASASVRRRRSPLANRGGRQRRQPGGKTSKAERGNSSTDSEIIERDIETGQYHKALMRWTGMVGLSVRTALRRKCPRCLRRSRRLSLGHLCPSATHPTRTCPQFALSTAAQSTAVPPSGRGD